MTTTIQPAELAASWCRMRTDNPTLADQLVTDDFRIWSDTDTNGEAVLGPHDLARVVTEAQDHDDVRFTSLLVAGDHRRIAFSWNATSSNGTVRTGIDVARRGVHNRIDASWSIVGERRNTLAAIPVSATPGATMQRVCARWTDMWNGDTHLAHGLVTDDFRIWFGTNRSADDSVLGPQAMADYVSTFRAQLGGVRFREEGDFVLDVDSGCAAVIWTVTLPPEARPEGASGSGPFDLGGIDLFQFAGDRIARVWSITGVRPHTLAN